ncbi:MAG: hypothetical protein AABX38_01755 [Candidatus Micrarchaeota archaeon]
MQSIDKEEVDIRKLSVYANLDIWSNKKKDDVWREYLKLIRCQICKNQE